MAVGVDVWCCCVLWTRVAVGVAVWCCCVVLLCGVDVWC